MGCLGNVVYAQANSVGLQELVEFVLQCLRFFGLVQRIDLTLQDGDVRALDLELPDGVFQCCQLLVGL